MAATDVIKLRAKARKLAIEGYKTMSVAELEKAIKGAGTSANGDAPAPRKTAAKVSTPRSTGKTAVRKTASVKSAPAKSASRATKAKRPTTRAATPKVEQPKRRGRPPGSKNRPKAQTTARVTKAQANHEPGRILIDNSTIDWKRETKIGNSGGNREIIMKAIRRFKGDVAKVFAHLADNAQEMYPKTQDGKRRSKSAAQALLRWHISRIKFDFVKETGQHNGITRSKAAGASQRAAKPKAKVSTRPKRAAAQKPAQRRTQATPKKTATKRATRTRMTRKTAASRKRR